MISKELSSLRYAKIKSIEDNREVYVLGMIIANAQASHMTDKDIIENIRNILDQYDTVMNVGA